MNRIYKLIILGIAATTSVAMAQESHQETASMSFEVASVRPAAPGSRPQGLDWMMPGPNKVPVPRGVLVMTAPVAAFISFAYSQSGAGTATVAIEKLPEWTKSGMYTVTARATGEPTIEQIRAMMRNLLTDRFSLKQHEEVRDSPVNKIVLIKPGKLGPAVKPHPSDETCTAQNGPPISKAPEPGKSHPLLCGFSLYPTSEGLLHVSMVDVSMADAGKMLGGLGGFAGGLAGRPTIDGTGLTGTYDLTFEFHPEVVSPGEAQRPNDAGGPTFTGVLEKQLGMRLEKTMGPLQFVTVDNVAQPTPN